MTWNATALASINAEADTALTDYDPPTRTEATSDKAEIITDLDDIKGTGFVKDTHSLFDIEGYVDILDDGTSGNAKIATDVAATLADTNELQGDDVPGLIAALNDISVSDLLTTQMTEAYAANGIAPTMAQSLFAIHQMLMEFSIAGTSYTVKQLDSSTTAFVVTLDDATNPTGNTR